jgi:hypothetical protein
LRFSWGEADVNNKIRKILNEGNLTLRLLTSDHRNSMLNKGKHKTEEDYIRGSSAYTNTIHTSFKSITTINLYHPGTGILNLML